jgi:hypothetical protein
MFVLDPQNVGKYNGPVNVNVGLDGAYGPDNILQPVSFRLRMLALQDIPSAMHIGVCR